MQCFLSCVLLAVMCFEGCGVCTVTVALHVSVLCVCSAWCSCVRMYVWCCLMRVAWDIVCCIYVGVFALCVLRGLCETWFGCVVSESVLCGVWGVSCDWCCYRLGPACVRLA